MPTAGRGRPANPRWRGVRPAPAIIRPSNAMAVPADGERRTVCLRCGTRIACRVHGPDRPGLPFVLVAGLAAPGNAIWRFVLPALQEARGPVLTFDNRGCGESDRPAGPYTMRMLAGDIEGVADHLNWHRFHLVGTAMGGMVAQTFALAHPHRIASLTLIATHAGGFRNRWPSLRSIPLCLGLWWGGTPPHLRLDALARLLYPPSFRRRAGRRAVRDMVAAEFEPFPSRADVVAQYAAVRGHDVRKHLPTLAGLATLVVKPTCDLLVSPRAIDRLHRAIPGSRLVCIRGAGHGVSRQCGQLLGDLIRDHAARAESHRAIVAGERGTPAA